MRVHLLILYLVTACSGKDVASTQESGSGGDDTGERDSEGGGDSGDSGDPAPSGCAPREDGYVTDTGVYDPPEVPELTEAGQTVVDATFGTTVLRVTDEDDDATGCLHAYSYWPTLNADSSRFVLYCHATGLLLYDFDWETLSLSKQGALFTSRTPEGGTPSWSDVFWSGSDPDVLFAHDGTRLYSYDVTTSSFELLRDFSDELGDRETIKQMSRSEDDDVFAWHTHDFDAASQGYLAWRRSTDEVLVRETGAIIDEVQLDKGGDWLLVKTGRQGAGVVSDQVVNLATGDVEDLLDNEPDYAPGHGDNGYGYVIGHDNWTNRLTRREFSAPHDVSTVLSFGSDWSFDYHVSLRARDEDWAVVSPYSYTERSSGVFHEEIFQLRTDGSGQVRRLAHHHGRYADYYDSPRANISADGCFVTFTSRWGGTERQDVYMLSLK